MKSSIYLGITLLATLLVFSCENGKKKDEVKVYSKEELKASINEMKDSLETLSKENGKIDNLHRIELINRMVDYYRAFPKDSYSAKCLDETQMIYSMLEAYEYAAAYSDTLIEMYPKYENRALVLESQGANYDNFIHPRDSSKVRKYYSMLVNENPNMDKDKREGVLKRLEKNHLTFDEFIEVVTPELN